MSNFPLLTHPVLPVLSCLVFPVMHACPDHRFFLLIFPIAFSGGLCISRGNSASGTPRAGLAQAPARERRPNRPVGRWLSPRGERGRHVLSTRVTRATSTPPSHNFIDTKAPALRLAHFGTINTTCLPVICTVHPIYIELAQSTMREREKYGANETQ